MTPFTTQLPEVAQLWNQEGTAVYVLFSCSDIPLFIVMNTQVCYMAEKSIRDVLNTGDNTDILLALHRPNTKDSQNSTAPSSTLSYTSTK